MTSVLVFVAVLMGLATPAQAANVVSAKTLRVTVTVPDNADCIAHPPELTDPAACEGLEPIPFAQAMADKGGDVVLHAIRRIPEGEAQAIVLATPAVDDGSTLDVFAANFIAGMLGEPALRNGTTRAPAGEGPFEIVDGGPIPGFRFFVDPSGAGAAPPGQPVLVVHTLVGSQAAAVVLVVGPPEARARLLSISSEVVGRVEMAAASIPATRRDTGAYQFGRNLAFVVMVSVAIGLIVVHRGRSRR